MRLVANPPNITDSAGFTPENDIFGYAEFGERFANLITTAEEPIIAVLDGPWGSGKSFFIRQWSGLLRQRGVPVIQFDAFANDHLGDAFLAIAAAIQTAATDLLGPKKTRKFLNKAKAVGKALLPVSARIGMRVGSAGLLSLDDLENAGEAAKALVTALTKEGERAVEKTISERLRKGAQEKASFDAFRSTLSELARAAGAKASRNATAPLVFIIDELDRCRPPFALELIERAKHFFSVPGVCFVLVGHLPHLESTVRGAYGASVDSQTYLEKFYQLRVLLPRETRRDKTRQQTYIDYLWHELRLRFAKKDMETPVRETLHSLASAHCLSLRQVERVLTHLAIVSAAAGERNLLIPPVVAGLCVMRHTAHPLYQKARNGELTWEEVERFLGPVPNHGVEDDWVRDWWRYVTEDEGMAPERKQRFQHELTFTYNIANPRRALSLMCGYLDEFQNQTKR